MQNTSHAVMAQRFEAHDSLDDFPTQPWATRALIEHVLMPVLVLSVKDLGGMSVWEPACNRGHMAEPLAENFGEVISSDICDYRWAGQQATCDFLFPQSQPEAAARANWVVTNPPFRLAEQFIRRSFDLPNWRGSAFIVRTSFLESVGRYEALFCSNPPAIIAQFSERVPMVKGRLTKTGSTATAYCWLVWAEGHAGTRFIWIPPCRKRLERPADYADYALEAAE